jgi:hypothetical protein
LSTRNLRGGPLFLAGLVLVVAALALVALTRRSAQVAPVATPSSSPRAPLLGPRDPFEPDPTATFQEQGRRSGADGSLYLLGMVWNKSPYAVDKPTVRAVLLDQDGGTIATSQGFAERDLLAPGESSPVKVLLTSVPPHASIKYEVMSRRALYDPGAVEGLKAEQDGEPKPNFGTWEISGRVLHQGKVAARGVKVELVIRNAAGKLIGVESTFVEVAELKPGESAAFKANVLLDEKPVRLKLSAFARPAP